jgi:hypothetical protein
MFLEPRILRSRQTAPQLTARAVFRVSIASISYFNTQSKQVVWVFVPIGLAACVSAWPFASLACTRPPRITRSGSRVVHVASGHFALDEILECCGTDSVGRRETAR